MPKSKRDKKTSLTQTKKKPGLEFKQNLVDEVRACVDKYARIFVFSVENMRNNKLKDVRTEWRHSRFFFGKNNVIAFALGRSPESEYRNNICKVSSWLRDQRGLLFTNEQKDHVLDYFNGYSEPDYARSGYRATNTMVLKKGPLEQFSHAMEPQLRKLGLPTTLQKGTITLQDDFVVCKEGDVLNSEQARILKLFGNEMALFNLTMECMWSNDGTFVNFCDAPAKKKK